MQLTSSRLEASGGFYSPHRSNLPKFFADIFRRRKLVRDLRIATCAAWQNGVEPGDVIAELLRCADEIATSAEAKGIFV
jgi:hypothetical protein